MKTNLIKTSILGLLVMGLWGCESVEPWEKGTLAQYSMRTERDPLDITMAEHVNYTREASHGGAGIGGGGCGCN
jgi:hypothetical protein